MAKGSHVLLMDVVREDQFDLGFSLIRFLIYGLVMGVISIILLVKNNSHILTRKKSYTHIYTQIYKYLFLNEYNAFKIPRQQWRESSILSLGTIISNKAL